MIAPKRGASPDDVPQQVARLNSLNDRLARTIEGVDEGKQLLHRFYHGVKEVFEELERDSKRKLDQFLDENRTSLQAEQVRQKQALIDLVEQSEARIQKLQLSFDGSLNEVRQDVQRLEEKAQRTLLELREEWAQVQKEGRLFRDDLSERMSISWRRTLEFEKTLDEFRAAIANVEEHYSGLFNDIGDAKMRVRSLESSQQKVQEQLRSRRWIYLWLGILTIGWIALMV